PRQRNGATWTSCAESAVTAAGWRCSVSPTGPGARTPDLGRLSEEWLRELFDDGWTIDELAPADILGIIPDGLGEISTWPRDKRGRTPMTGWRLLARRTGEPNQTDASQAIPDHVAH
ncbi:hypothetical protein, partial [Sciscionella marina]|uniref:hypothetical protein n=1 Tax=Sciscionella marina TaxID=508770 RepID=UPI00058AEFB2